MRQTRWASRASVGMVVAAVITLTSVAPASAATVEEPCSHGDALALWESFATFVTREQGYPPCQYRLFWDREHVTFHEGDWFVGASAFFLFYEELEQFGMTRQEGIAELENISGRLWLGEIGARGKVGTLIEKPLMTTGYKDGRLGDAILLFRQDGVILNLPPGDYLSVYEVTCNSEFWEFIDCRMGKVYHYEVTLHILPA